MKRIAKLGLVALIAGAVAAVVARFRRPAEAPVAPADERADELRAKLAEARAAAADQDDFEAAGMGAETIVEEPPAQPPVEPEEPEAAPPAAPPPAPPPPRPGSKGPPPQDEFEAMRRRIHEEGKAAAEEMRRSADPKQPEPRQPEPEQPEPDKP